MIPFNSCKIQVIKVHFGFAFQTSPVDKRKSGIILYQSDQLRTCFRLFLLCRMDSLRRFRYHVRFIIPDESVISAITGLIKLTFPSLNDLFLKSILLMPTIISLEYSRVSLFLSLISISLIDNLLKNLYSIEPMDIVDLIWFEK